MFFGAVIAVTLAPALMTLLIRGKIRPEKDHPVSRFLIMLYKPFVYVALRNPKTTIAIGLAAILSALPMVPQIGSEFMPPLNEGDILYMPTTFPNISVEEAKQYMQFQDRVIRSFPEVISVYGKAGRAETPTDPAPLSMLETIVQLKPREEWRKIEIARWYSGWAPEFLKKRSARSGRRKNDHLGGAGRGVRQGDADAGLDERVDDADQDADRHALDRDPHADRRQDLRPRPRRDRAHRHGARALALEDLRARGASTPTATPAGTSSTSSPTATRSRATDSPCGTCRT